MLAALRQTLEAIPSITLAYVFGSCARDEAGDGSDVDLAVLGPVALGLERRALLIEQLERALAFRWRVDLVDLRAAPPVLAAQIVRRDAARRGRG